MDFKDFWYIAAESKELKPNRVLSLRILDEWIALFRDENGRAVALEDRCLHRCARLSKGRVTAGRLQCAYHGWTYDGRGCVVAVPSEGPNGAKSKHRHARSFQVCEQDDYVYVRLIDEMSQSELVPEARGILNLSVVSGFLLNFVLVDYLYYWNHRCLHCRRLWPAHAVHHTPKQADVFITSRNTLWTPLLIVYLWINGLFLFLLRDPGAYIFAASLTASLDLWRHSSFSPRPGSTLHRALGRILITPHEHAWHHSRDRADCNFGANLSLWDRLHGTYHSPTCRAEKFGAPLTLSLKRKLLFPFSI